MANTELQERIQFYCTKYAIYEHGKSFTVFENNEYFSDSCNPKGEYVQYWGEVKTYKSLKAAQNWIVKNVLCHFPNGYFT